MLKNKVNTSDIIIKLLNDKSFLIEQNNQKDLIIEDLKSRLNNYERSNVQC